MKIGPRQQPEAPRAARSDAPPSASLDWIAPEGAGGIVTGYVEQLLRRKARRRRATLGWAGVSAAIVGGFLWWSHPASNLETSTVRSAMVSVPQRHTLPDGSVVELNHGAEIATEFTDSVRGVTLKRGEALFQVARVADRPFVVTAGSVQVRAIGTAFAVQLGTAAVDVLVTEGQVAVTSEGKGMATVSSAGGSVEPSADVRVTAGNRVRVPMMAESRLVPSAPAPAAVVPVPPAEVTERLAWRMPRVELSYTPLGEAIAIFSKHSGVRVTLAEPSLGQLELSGNLRADNIDSLLQLLAEEFKIRADRRGDEITLRR